MVGVGEADADWLINKEDVRVIVPGVWVERNVVNVIDPAGAYLP